MRRFIALFVLCIFACTSQAEVIRVEIDSRTPILNGMSFDVYGSYELVEGRIYFAFDPDNAMNSRITDLAFAPRNADGKVEAWANIVVLQPVDPDKRRGVALVEVSNRGGKFSPRYFNRATAGGLDPNNHQAFGDALLMRQGLTVIWIGWQFDVPEREGVLRLHVPIAQGEAGEAIEGLVRSDWTLDQPTNTLYISHRNHFAYPVSNPDDAANVLTVRDGREEPRREIPRDQWQFARKIGEDVVADDEYIYMEDGFEAGHIYELVYRSAQPAVVGLGLAAIRDVMAYAKYDDEAVFPVAYGFAAGVSQTGRFLRHFVYQGFNTDERGRQVYDGLMMMTAGAGRGSFNHRFAQPSRDAHPYSAFFYPTDIFPFTTATQTDLESGWTDGLLAHQHNDTHIPKIFQINTGYEYWGRAASLIHTSPDGKEDAPLHPNERIYHIASGQHFVGRFPGEATPAGRYNSNPMNFLPVYRALMVKMVNWVANDEPPPPSAYPRVADGSLVHLEGVDFPSVSGVTFPDRHHVAYRADYGPRWGEGIVDNQPPPLGTPFVPMVSQVDEIGNEIAGVRTVEVRVPLATYTPWNLRTGAPGGEEYLRDFTGQFIPLSRTDEERAARQDDRPSITALYADRADYLQQVETAARELQRAGFLLKDDMMAIIERARQAWEFVFSD